MAQSLKNLKRSPVTLVLMAINIGLWIIIRLTMSDTHSSPLIYYGASQSILTAHGDFWRLLTSGFLHEEFYHLLANIVFLSFLGPLSEWLYTRKSYIVLVLVTTIYASLFSFAFGDSYTWGLGFSGAGCGMIGIILGFLLYYRHDELLVPITKQMIPIWIFSVIVILFIPNVGHIAHIGGYISGFLMCGILQSVEKRELKNANYISLGLLIALGIVLFVIGFRKNIIFDPSVLGI